MASFHRSSETGGCRMKLFQYQCFHFLQFKISSCSFFGKNFLLQSSLRFPSTYIWSKGTQNSILFVIKAICYFSKLREIKEVSSFVLFYYVRFEVVIKYLSWGWGLFLTFRNKIWCPTLQLEELVDTPHKDLKE